MSKNNGTINILIFFGAMAAIVYLLYYVFIELPLKVGKGVADAISDNIGAIGDTIASIPQKVLDTAQAADKALVGVVTDMQEKTVPTFIAGAPPAYLRYADMFTAGLTTPVLKTMLDIAPTIIPALVKDRIPLAKLYKDGKWYLLVGCDTTGHNCEAHREATWLDQIALAMATDVTNL